TSRITHLEGAQRARLSLLHVWDKEIGESLLDLRLNLPERTEQTEPTREVRLQTHGLQLLVWVFGTVVHLWLFGVHPCMATRSHTTASTQKFEAMLFVVLCSSR